MHPNQHCKIKIQPPWTKASLVARLDASDITTEKFCCWTKVNIAVIVIVLAIDSTVKTGLRTSTGWCSIVQFATIKHKLIEKWSNKAEQIVWN
jgi:hypothetical protein